MTLDSGARLGRYRIESLIGRGGMGAVYLATDTALERRVALKVLSPELTHDPRFRERFMTESRIAASLDHPNIVPVYEAGEIDGQLFIAMRYIDGADLAARLSSGPLPVPLAVRIVAAVAAALDAAHSRGLVHRDVKPGNVLLAGTEAAPHVYLTDFGLSKRLGDASLTAAGQIVGSIGYVAPEQVEGRPVDARTDVYSLGCLAYELLAGTQPFRRDSEMAVLMAHVADPPPSLLAARPELPEALDAAIARAMAKDPAARYPSAGEFAAALAAAAQPDGGALARGFLFADLRGYTAYVESHGDETAAGLLEVYRRMMRKTIARHGGAEIKTEGDSFYVVFPSASGAVACGLAVVAAAAAASLEDPEHPIRVGVGVNAGEAVAAAEGYVGSAVNIAARVCAQAKPGEVLVTDTVRGLTRTSGRLRFTPVGKRALKGIAEPLALFHVEAADGPPSTAPPPPPFWRRPTTLAAAAGGLVMLGLAVVAAKGGFAPASSPSPSTGPSLAPPVAVERLVYSAEPRFNPADPISCDQSQENRLMLVAPTGGEALRVLPPGDLYAWQPSWSPDGTRLAFVGVNQSDEASPYVVGVNGAGLKDLVPSVPPGVDSTPNFISKPAWSADGLRLLFVYGDFGVWEVAPDGRDLHQLIPPLPAPAVTPDPDGVTPDVFPPAFVAAGWMADGRIGVAVSTQDKDSPTTRLYAASSDGSGLAPLAGMPDGVDVTLPAWGPGGEVAFVQMSPPSIPDGPFLTDLYVLDAGSSAPRLIAGSTGISGAASWSPDGTRLAFAAGKLYTVQPDGKDLAEVPIDPGTAACSVDWGRTTTLDLPQPTPTPIPGVTPPPQAFHRGVLEPGTYLDTVFVPHMQMTFGSGWFALFHDLDGMAIGRPDARQNEIDVGRVQVVFDTPCLLGATRTIGPTAREFLDFIQHNPYLEAGNPRPVTIGGRTGLTIDVVVARTPTASECPDEPDRLLNRVWLFEIGQSSFWFGDQHRVRITSIDVGDGPAVTLVYGGDPQDADAFITSAQAVIDSITFP